MRLSGKTHAPCKYAVWSVGNVFNLFFLATKEKEEVEQTAKQQQVKEPAKVKMSSTGNSAKQCKTSQGSSSEEDMEWFQTPKRPKVSTK